MEIFKIIWRLAFGGLVGLLLVILIIWKVYEIAIPNFKDIDDQYKMLFNLQKQCTVSRDKSTNCITPINETLTFIGILAFSLCSGIAVVSYFADENFNQSVFKISLLSSIIVLLFTMGVYSYKYNQTTTVLKSYFTSSSQYESFLSQLPHMIYLYIMMFATVLASLFAGTGIVAFICDKIYIEAQGVASNWSAPSGGGKKYRKIR